MKKLLNLLIIGLLLVGLTGPVFAQNAQLGAGTAITQTATTGQASTACSASTLGSAQQTLTLVNPGTNLSYYLTALGAWAITTGAVTNATPTMVTMTGVAGTSPSLMPIPSAFPAIPGGAGGVAGGYVPLISPIKTLAGTAVTIVGPTAIVGMNQQLMACYYIAP